MLGGHDAAQAHPVLIQQRVAEHIRVFSDAGLLVGKLGQYLFQIIGEVGRVALGQGAAQLHPCWEQW